MSDKFAGILREAKQLALVIGLLLFAQTVAAQPFTIPSSSMEPTLLVGDKLLASKFAYGYSKYSAPISLMPDFEGRIFDREPERGDVIVFRLPRDTSVNYVKRVIGLPGDTIQMHEGRLYINGTKVPRREAGTFVGEMFGLQRNFTRYIETLPNGHEHEVLELSDFERLDDTPVFTVPAGHYFMMGDNRDNSIDSRVAAMAEGVGLVPEENLIGRADVILYSIDPDVAWWQITQWPSAFRRFFTHIG